MTVQEVDQRTGIIADVVDLGGRPLEHDGHGRVGHQSLLEPGEDVDLRPLDVDLHDVDAWEIGQEVVERQGLHLDDLLSVAQAGQSVGPDGPDARVAGEVLTEVQLELGCL